MRRIHPKIRQVMQQGLPFTLSELYRATGADRANMTEESFQKRLRELVRDGMLSHSTHSELVGEKIVTIHSYTLIESTPNLYDCLCPLGKKVWDKVNSLSLFEHNYMTNQKGEGK